MHQHYRETRIPRLADLLAKARDYEAEGDSIEALFCYDGVLKDPLVTTEPEILHLAASDMCQLLHRRVVGSIEPARVRRLLDRAIKAMEFARSHSQPRPADALVLAALYTTYHDLLADPRHLLAARLLLEDAPVPTTD